MMSAKWYKSSLTTGTSPKGFVLPLEKDIIWACLAICKRKQFLTFSLLNFSRLPGQKLHTLDSSQDAILLLRAIGTVKQRAIYLRDYRPHLLAEAVSFEQNEDQVLWIISVQHLTLVLVRNTISRKKKRGGKKLVFLNQAKDFGLAGQFGNVEGVRIRERSGIECQRSRTSAWVGRFPDEANRRPDWSMRHAGQG